MPQTTSLTEIRDFLAAEGCAPEPWSTPEAALQRLYALLVERNDDERFWARLKELTRRLDRGRFDPSALPEFETLGSAAVDRLVDDLRKSLGDGDGDKSQRTLGQWLSSNAGMALVAFLMFGISISCADDEPEPEPTWTVNNWSCQAQADYYDITDDDERDRLCSLGDYVNGADVYDSDKNLMLDCLPDLSAAYRMELLDQFQNATAEELNDILTEMTAWGGTCEEDYSGHYGGGCGFH